MKKKVRKAREKKFTLDEVERIVANARKDALECQAMAIESPKPSLDRKALGEHVAMLISSERNDTHGDPHIQFQCAQMLKQVMRDYHVMTSGRSLLGTAEQESLEMICTKISRLVCGSNLQDAWLDIAGYALIAAEKAEKPL